MARPHIVVDAADAQLARVALGMLYAEHKGLPYPHPGGLYVWDPKPSADGTEVAFGPCDTLDGDPDDASWALGQSIETGIGTLTMPAAAQQLEDSWFPPPPSSEW